MSTKLFSKAKKKETHLSSVETKELLSIYENSLTSRILDEQLQEWFYKEETRVQFSGVGSEVGPSSIVNALEPEDYLIPRYRGYAAVLGKGIPVEQIIDEVFNRQSGASRGIGDVCSFRDARVGIPGYAINLGSMFAVSIGLAFSIKYHREKKIVVHLFGDGEASRTSFGGALNLAVLWELPILFVCENNGVSINTKFTEMSSTHTVAQRGSGYDCGSETCQEIQVTDLLQRSKYAITKVRKESKPFLLEVKQERFVPHSTRYSRSPVTGSFIPHSKDPLIQLENILIQQKAVSVSDAQKKKKSITEVIEKLIQNALKKEPLSKEDLLSIYHE